MAFFFISLLNGVSYGLLLFMLSAGLTLIFSMMGVLNFAHASFYMLGAYIGYALSEQIGFWPALVIAPVVVGGLGALFEGLCLRKVHPMGHVPELLVTFGLSYILLELVQLVWGRATLGFSPPEALMGPAFTLIHQADGGLSLVAGAAQQAVCQADGVVCTAFPATRAFMMGVALLMLFSMGLLMSRTRVGLVIQAALTHPQMVEALGHNLPRVFMGVFGVGTGLAGLAGVMGGSTFVTEPQMAASVGMLVFVVVVVGGLGSLRGAFIASLLIGVVQTFAVGLDQSLAGLAQRWGIGLSEAAQHNGLLSLRLSQLAPVLPYLFLVLVLAFRPRGLMGRREG